MANRKSPRLFPGGPYLLLHTLSHLLLQSLSMRCGYPANSIRERVYADVAADRFGVLLYTGSPDAEGTLGGLVQEARHIEDHLVGALRMSALCSNDPVCAQHGPARAWRNVGSTVQPAMVARWSQRRPARCATITWTVR